MALCAHLNYIILFRAAEFLELFQHESAQSDFPILRQHTESLELCSAIALVLRFDIENLGNIFVNIIPLLLEVIKTQKK